MDSIRRALGLTLVAGVALGLAIPVGHGSVGYQETQPAATRPVGTIKAINGFSLTLVTDAGTEVGVAVTALTKMVRVEPGQKDLKGAAPVKFQDLQTGDRILVRGTASPDGKTVTAVTIIVMKSADVAQRQQREREDWDKRGVGGLVSAVDPALGTIQIKAMGLGGSKTVTIRTTKETIIRRYQPDSPKFDDAVPGALDQVKPGDQLRARGKHNPEGTEVAAEEIVSGTFRNVAGLVVATDPAANTITVSDLATKKPVVVKITADSQLHKMPEMLAQRLAFMLRAANGGNGERGPRPQMAPARANGGGRPGGGAADLPQMLSRMPTVTFPELQKGEAVMIVTTASAAVPTTAITLLSGVDPILRASPNDPQAAALLSWSLSSGGGGESAPPQ